MKNLDHDPCILTGRAPISDVQQLPRFSQLEAPDGYNLHESNTISMRHVPINIPPTSNEAELLQSFPTLPSKFHHYKKIWKFVLTVALFAMFPSLAQVGQLKFTNKSPFETHMFFSNMGVVSYVIAIPTSVLFFAMANYIEDFSNECSSRICYFYMILRCVFCFSAILAPLSLVLVLLIPNEGYYWIRFHHYKKIWKFVLTVALFAMFPSLAQVGQLKFTNKSPFETHMFFSNMGVVSYVIAIPTSVLFFAMANYIEDFANECSSRIYYFYMILRCVFCFSAILAPLSFVLVLLIPNEGYYWIGYLIISLLFVVIVTYNVIDYLELRCKIKSSNLA